MTKADIKQNKNEYSFWLMMHRNNNGDGYFGDGISLHKFPTFILYSDDEHYEGAPSHYKIYFKDGRNSIKSNYGESLEDFIARLPESDKCTR